MWKKLSILRNRTTQDIYEKAFNWAETNELRLLVVLDETRLLKAKNLVHCLSELGKLGVGFVMVARYSASISPEARNVGTYFHYVCDERNRDSKV